MLRTLTRLGGMSSVRSWTVQASSSTTVSSRLSIASFHMGRPSAVAVSPNAATTPSTPLPPPMNSSTQQTDIERSSQAQVPASVAETQKGTAATATAAVAAAVPTTKAATTPTTATTTASVATTTADGQENKKDEVESSNSVSGFAEFVPVSPEQIRSMEDNPILKQLVNTIMKDGKKARAQRFVADALLEIRSRTHSDPYQVVLDAMEQASPILKLTAVKKGSKVLQVPSPMTERQRRRKAIVWILEASDKRKGGEKQFKDRLASEFLAVVNGNSGALVKKNQLHKMALANRANAALKY
ncbi:hypothetical protein EDD11_007323 [Mortierella claussenii]|nr:hypothetical protein EDD11_007323 [Mortierella claussenii]